MNCEFMGEAVWAVGDCRKPGVTLGVDEICGELVGTMVTERGYRGEWGGCGRRGILGIYGTERGLSEAVRACVRLM